MESEVLEDLTRVHSHLGHVDAILFTGDLTQRGAADEFARFNDIMAEIRRHLAQLGSEPVLLAVPGNHDLVRPPKGDAVVRALRAWLANTSRRFDRRRGGAYRECHGRAVARLVPAAREASATGLELPVLRA